MSTTDATDSTTTMTSDAEPLSSDALRLCCIVKWENFDGYGFNLRAEKGKPGQFIGKVDEGSPAEAAGLREGDRIVEVNDVNIVNENHKQVVQRIKAVANETRLLVVDSEGDAYFKNENIVVNSSLACVKIMKTPLAEPDNANCANVNANPNPHSPSVVVDDNVSQKSTKSQQSSKNESSPSASIISQETEKTTNDNSSNDDHQMNDNTSSLNLNMTAKELRAQLAAKKKYDPKKDSSINFRKKYDIVQKL